MGQSLLFHCLETGFIATAPALARSQQGRSADGTVKQSGIRRTSPMN